MLWSSNCNRLFRSTTYPPLFGKTLRVVVAIVNIVDVVDVVDIVDVIVVSISVVR
jgi:hypothetical protein